jgi:anti-sigma regulatory factor (Ser/Thr protein kinase)
MHFSTLFPTTRRGAHEARHAAERWLADRLPSADANTTTASLLIAELAANAAVHGRVRGRAARLTVSVGPTEIRVEVTDARGDRLPVARQDETGESGRGLLLIAHVATDWGVRPHHPGGKTVWAVCGR